MTLSVSGLCTVRAGRTVLHPTSFTIGENERVGLVGASGSGKSTLAHALVDAMRSEGVRVAHVPQSPDDALDPLRSMAFHWREAAQAVGCEPDESERERLFDALHIQGGDMNGRPWAWSRGMQQRFVIAMALLGEPQLVVLDEPTSALDPVVAADTMDLLDASLDARATAAILITHDLGLAARRVSRLMVLDSGRIVEDAPTESLLSSPTSDVARLLVAHRSWDIAAC